MSKLTKNKKLALAKIENGKAYTIDEAAQLVKEITFTKFDASVDIDVRLGVDPRKANQMVRGVVTLPHGTGKEITIKALTELVAEVVGYHGEIKWDPSKPNGTPRKLLDVSKATNMGWTYKTELRDGIRLAYEDFLNNPMRAER